MKSSTTEFDRAYRPIAKNRKARYEYMILQVFEAGIELKGTEVKSLRQGKCSMQESYATFKSSDDTEIYLKNFHINPYDHGNIQNHEPKRDRKLLVNYREAVKMKTQVQEKGNTIVPLKIYFSGAFVKVEIAVVRAKKKYDKRETSKKREQDREIQRKFRA